MQRVYTGVLKMSSLFLLYIYKFFNLHIFKINANKNELILLSIILSLDWNLKVCKWKSCGVYLQNHKIFFFLFIENSICFTKWFDAKKSASCYCNVTSLTGCLLLDNRQLLLNYTGEKKLNSHFKRRRWVRGMGGKQKSKKRKKVNERRRKQQQQQ